MIIRKVQLGIDALEFLESITAEEWEQIDTVVFDPPYYSDKDIEKVNQRSKLKSKQAQWKKQYTRIMDEEHRNTILEFIRSKNPKYIIHFHMDQDYGDTIENLACTHIWVKPIHITMAGNNDRNNGEFIFIEGPRIKGKLKGRVLNKYIYGHISGMLPRACAKPTFLFKELYRHLDSKGICDPFAGYAASIAAAVEIGVSVLACDIDSSIDSANWNTSNGLEAWI